MSPFSHGNIIVAIVGILLICGGSLSKQIKNEDNDERPGTSVPQVSQVLSSKFSRQQHQDFRRDLHTVHSKGVPSTMDKEINGESGEEADAVKAVTYSGLDDKPVNVTELLVFLVKQEARRQLNRDAQWAYMCVVVVLCLMMWAMWWLGGLQRCRYRSEPPTSFSNSQPLMSVQEVMRRQQQYLPMFTDPEWEEVLMIDRATDP